MPVKWCQLGEVAHVYVGVPTVIGAHDGTDRMRHVLTVRCLTGTSIDLTEMAQFELPDRDLEKYAVQAGDVLMSARSTSLKTGIVPKEAAGTIINATILGIRSLPKLEPRILVAWLGHPEGQSALASVAQTGTAQMNITVAAISKIMVPVPPLNVQRQIAAMLEAADEAYHVTIQAAENRRQLAKQVMVDWLHKKETT